jgi:cellulose synthase/poly-beta-1,6-N-acetylglucosamine synthase-like glycosyltransferase
VTPATASVVICAYTTDRWDDLCAAVASVADQSVPAHEVVVVVDHNPGLAERARTLPEVRVVANDRGRGLSGARNTGIAATTGDVVAFLDDDATADRRWLEHLVGALAVPDVLVAGGTALPAWAAGRPAWFPEEFDWVVGCTYRHGATGGRPVAVRNPLGCNMAFRREAFELAGGFREGIGRIGSHPLGCEETELCIRLGQAAPDAVVLHEPRAVVHHRVPAQRGTFRYFGRRCWAEGLSKASVSGHVGTRDGLATERSYATVTLPRGVARGVADSLGRRRPGGLGRAGAIVAGLGLTAAGYARGRVSGTAATPTPAVPSPRPAAS